MRSLSSLIGMVVVMVMVCVDPYLALHQAGVAMNHWTHLTLTRRASPTTC